ncbi:unnamed protein product [Chrysodeixis includens]|uniref:Uncharacterized protein n=1 Tax=Chrysodeixis includens TaxID=689277 RepID=A0A9N8L0I9_CHRIL|nr:unnamed protein product [Chrysodeixis includens]
MMDKTQEIPIPPQSFHLLYLYLRQGQTRGRSSRNSICHSTFQNNSILQTCFHCDCSHRMVDKTQGSPISPLSFHLLYYYLRQE